MPAAPLHRFKRSSLIAAGFIGLAALAAGAHGQAIPGSNIGPQAQARIQIRLSVRPMVRIGQLSTPASRPAGISPGPLCLWSNFEARQYGLRAEWSDGQSFELGVPDGAEDKCSKPGMRPVGLEASPGPGAGQAAGRRLVMLMIEGR